MKKITLTQGYEATVDNPECAAKAFDEAALRLYGDFCGKLNFARESK